MCKNNILTIEKNNDNRQFRILTADNKKEKTMPDSTEKVWDFLFSENEINMLHK